MSIRTQLANAIISQHYSPSIKETIRKLPFKSYILFSGLLLNRLKHTAVRHYLTAKAGIRLIKISSKDRSAAVEKLVHQCPALKAIIAERGLPCYIIYTHGYFLTRITRYGITTNIIVVISNQNVRIISNNGCTSMYFVHVFFPLVIILICMIDK